MNLKKKGRVPIKRKVKPKIRWRIRERDGQKEKRETICFITSI